MSAETVTVACLIVNGVSLRLTRPGIDDGTGVKPLRLAGKEVSLKGPAARASGTTSGLRTVGNAVLNEGVDKAFMTEWLAQNEHNPIVKSGSIFMVEK